jgi:hypothetical protein
VLFKCEFSTQALQAAGLEQYIVPCNQPCRSIHGSIQEICNVLQWQKPPIGWYKCNVDAGFHKETDYGLASVSVVVE